MPSANNRETDRLLLLRRSASVRQLATMKKKPGAREGACAIVLAVATQAYSQFEPYLVDLLPVILELCADKMKFVEPPHRLQRGLGRSCEVHVDASIGRRPWQRAAAQLTRG